MKIEAILFDKDGTLFDFQASWAGPMRMLLEELAPGAAMEPAAEALGFDLARGRFRPDSVVIAGTTGEVAQSLAPVVDRSIADVLQRLDRMGAEAPQVPAVPLGPCLTHLRQCYRLGVATNDSEAPARAHLAQEGVAELFDFIAGYDSGFGQKPGPGQVLAFAEAVATPPERILMVGDSRHDLTAARAAGAVPVAVLTGISASADLAPLARAILPDIGHLAGWLDKNDTMRRKPGRETV